MAIRLEWTCELSDAYEQAVMERWIGKLEQLLQLASQTANIESGTVSLSFVDEDAIRQLNKRYRGVDHATDVLSFAMEEGDDGEDIEDVAAWHSIDEDMERMLGDIVISLPTAQEQSELYGHSLEREIGFLFVHGFLHLIGYDHQDEASEEEMFNLQEEILEQAGLER